MINTQRLEELFTSIVRLDSSSGEEREVADFITEKLRDFGLDVREDKAAENTGGNTGNILARLPGKNCDGPTIMLTAHMDRVQPGKNIEPVLEDNIYRSAGDTILAADDVVGIAVILEAVNVLKEKELDHPPVELVFTVAEEVGLLGAKSLNPEDLQADMGYAFDCNGPVGNVIVKGPTHNGIQIKVRGRSAHAGVSPEEGINAIKVVSHALSRIDQGRIDGETTINIGTIKGGRARNVVPDEVDLSGEIRSQDPKRLEEETEKMKEIFENVAAEYEASVEFKAENLYPSFEFSSREEVVQRCVGALKRIGREPSLQASGGGSDANIFNGKGVPTLNLATGMEKAHSTEEYLPQKELIDLGRLTLELLRV